MVPPAKKPRTEEGAEAGAEADAAMEAEEPKEPTELEASMGSGGGGLERPREAGPPGGLFRPGRPWEGA